MPIFFAIVRSDMPVSSRARRQAEPVARSLNTTELFLEKTGANLSDMGYSVCALSAYVKRLFRKEDSPLAKMHEILAVEPARREALLTAIGELGVELQSSELFLGFIRRYHPFDESDQNEAGIHERQAVTTTVDKTLEKLVNPFSVAVDAVWQKERTNATASARIELPGFAFDAPVTFLLYMEKTLTKLRGLFETIPVHQIGMDWEEDGDHELSGVMKVKHPIESQRTRKVVVPQVLYDATPEHPAQVEKLSEDKVIGKFMREIWSGMWSAAEKAALMERTDQLIEAVRTARMRANEVDADTTKVSDQFMDYLLNKTVD